MILEVKFLERLLFYVRILQRLLQTELGYFIQELFIVRYDLSVVDVDLLTGPIMGRPKSATFRTCDVVGLDTLIHVANGLKQNCPNDERSEAFNLPDFISKMKDNNWLGSKTGQGFYKKTVNKEGKKEILSLDFKSLNM